MRNSGGQIAATGSLLQSQASSQRPVYDENGQPIRIQRTQLLNLQPAGGKKNSTMNAVGDEKMHVQAALTQEQIESLEEQFAKQSQAALS